MVMGYFSFVPRPSSFPILLSSFGVSRDTCAHAVSDERNLLKGGIRLVKALVGRWVERGEERGCLEGEYSAAASLRGL
jgi:hypothetical protein